MKCIIIQHRTELKLWNFQLDCHLLKDWTALGGVIFRWDLSLRPVLDFSLKLSLVWDQTWDQTWTRFLV